MYARPVFCPDEPDEKERLSYMVTTGRASNRDERTKVASTREERRCPSGHDSRPPARRPRRLGPPSPVRPSSDCASRATSPPTSPAAQEYRCGTARPTPCGRTPASTRWVHLWWWRRLEAPDAAGGREGREREEERVEGELCGEVR